MLIATERNPIPVEDTKIMTMTGLHDSESHPIENSLIDKINHTLMKSRDLIDPIHLTEEMALEKDITATDMMIGSNEEGEKRVIIIILIILIIENLMRIISVMKNIMICRLSRSLKTRRQKNLMKPQTTVEAGILFLVSRYVHHP